MYKIAGADEVLRVGGVSFASGEYLFEVAGRHGVSFFVGRCVFNCTARWKPASSRFMETAGISRIPPVSIPNALHIITVSDRASGYNSAILFVLSFSVPFFHLRDKVRRDQIF